MWLGFGWNIFQIAETFIQLPFSDATVFIAAKFILVIN